MPKHQQQEQVVEFRGVAVRSCQEVSPNWRCLSLPWLCFRLIWIAPHHQSHRPLSFFLYHGGKAWKTVNVPLALFLRRCLFLINMLISSSSCGGCLSYCGFCEPALDNYFSWSIFPPCYPLFGNKLRLPRPLQVVEASQSSPFSLLIWISKFFETPAFLSNILYLGSSEINLVRA